MVWSKLRQDGKGDFQTHLICMGDVKSLNKLLPVRTDGISLSRTTLREEDGSLNGIGRDLGPTPQLRWASCCQ